MVASLITIISIVLIVILYTLNLYTIEASKPIPEIQGNALSNVEKYLSKGREIMGNNEANTYSLLPIIYGENSNNLNAIINATDIDYVEKKDLLEGKIRNLISNTNNTKTEIDAIKQGIITFGFIPQEIKGILEEENAIASIQRSLNSLEIIKFTTAVKVFSYMDSAITILSNGIGINKNSLEEFLYFLSERGENDISKYVFMCYLNPYEIGEECRNIGDFDLYYESIAKDASLDRTLFKKVMRYINIMLEQSDIPNFSILFNGFENNAKNINFTIEINTLKQDETSLLSKKIKNPHIFILTNLINLLKQSLFIIGEDIQTKSIDIINRTLTIGNISYNVNTSTNTFSLPIQSSTTREIFDYIDIDSLIALDEAFETPKDTTNEEGSEEIPTGEENNRENEDLQEFITEEVNTQEFNDRENNYETENIIEEFSTEENEIKEFSTEESEIEEFSTEENESRTNRIEEENIEEPSPEEFNEF